MADLTPKQEAFALAYFECGNAAEAYRTAYNVSENTRDHWLYVEASQLLDHPEVALRLEALKEQAAQIRIYNRVAALDELEEARRLALEEKQASAAVSAVNSKVKLMSLDRPRQIQVTGKDGGPIETKEVSAREELADRLARLASRSGESGDSGEPDG